MKKENEISQLRLKNFLDIMYGMAGRRTYPGIYSREMMEVFLLPLFDDRGINWRFFLDIRKRVPSKMDRKEEIVIGNKVHTMLITSMLINAIMKTFEQKGVLSFSDKGGMPAYQVLGEDNRSCLNLCAANPEKRHAYFTEESEANAFVAVLRTVEDVRACVKPVLPSVTV